MVSISMMCSADDVLRCTQEEVCTEGAACARAIRCAVGKSGVHTLAAYGAAHYHCNPEPCHYCHWYPLHNMSVLWQASSDTHNLFKLSFMYKQQGEGMLKILPNPLHCILSHQVLVDCSSIALTVACTFGATLHCSQLYRDRSWSIATSRPCTRWLVSIRSVVSFPAGLNSDS